MKFILATITALLLFSCAFGQTTTTTADDKINAEIDQLFKDAETDFAPIRGDVASRTEDEIIYKTTKNYFQSAGFTTTLKFHSGARLDELLLTGSGKDAEKVFNLVKAALKAGAEIKSSSDSDEFIFREERIAQLMKQGGKFYLWFYSNRNAWEIVSLERQWSKIDVDKFFSDLDFSKDLISNYDSLAKQCNDLFYKKKDFVKTIETCTEAIKLKGNNADLYQIRGISYFLTPDKPKTGLDAMTSFGSANKTSAIADLTKCTELASTKPDCFYSLGFVQRKTLKTDEFDQAAKNFSEAIRLKSTDKDVYFQRAEAYREFYSRDEFFDNKTAQIRQRKELAVADYTKDIELRPTNIESRMGRGLVYLDLNKYDLAVADFTKALDLLNASGKQNPDYLRGILENRATAYKALGKNTEYCNDMKAIGKACEK
jgi:tetratricopeptide (TPR) repeat protein